MSGSRRVGPTMSSEFRRIVVLPSMTTSGEGTWNRSPLLRAAGRAFLARCRRSSYPSDTDDVQGPGHFKGCGLTRRRSDEAEMNRGRAQRTRPQLGVELGCDEVGMAGQLQDLHAPSIVGTTDEPQARVFELRDVCRVDFISVTVPFVDRRGGVQLCRAGLRIQLDRMGPESHRRPHALDRMLLREQVDDRVRSLRIEFRAVRAFQPQGLAGAADGRTLEYQAHALEGDSALGREPSRGDLP